ncbi:hypothetical protein [Eggerthella timonensis]|uniref:hypothetical protein n=1 Tax=Eggerthella timonensis TaxID=1871008 RepID=UPI0011AF88C1|nr:hypothetical protein [Eggerthella timonensis]
MTKSSLDALEGWRGCPLPALAITSAAARWWKERLLDCRRSGKRLAERQPGARPTFEWGNLATVQLFSPVLLIFRLCGKFIPKNNLVTRPFPFVENGLVENRRKGVENPLWRSTALAIKSKNLQNR